VAAWRRCQAEQDGVVLPSVSSDSFVSELVRDMAHSRLEPEETQGSQHQDKLPCRRSQHLRTARYRPLLQCRCAHPYQTRFSNLIGSLVERGCRCARKLAASAIGGRSRYEQLQLWRDTRQPATRTISASAVQRFETLRQRVIDKEIASKKWGLFSRAWRIYAFARLLGDVGCFCSVGVCLSMQA